MNIIKFGLSGAAVAALAILLIRSHGATQTLRRENQVLMQQDTQSADVRQANPQPAGPQTQGSPPAALPEEQFRELLKLRGEVGRLRQQAKPVAADTGANPAAAPAQPLVDLPKESWAFAGYAEPQSAFRSFLWAGTTGDAKKMLESMIPEVRQEAKTPADEQRMAKIISANVSKWTGVGILAQQMPDESHIVYTVNIKGAGGREAIIKMCLKRIGAEWKYAGEHAADWNP